MSDDVVAFIYSLNLDIYGALYLLRIHPLKYENFEYFGVSVTPQPLCTVSSTLTHDDVYPLSLCPFLSLSLCLR